MKTKKELEEALVQMEKKKSDLEALKESAESLQQWPMVRTAREELNLLKGKQILLMWVLKDSPVIPNTKA